MSGPDEEAPEPKPERWPGARPFLLAAAIAGAALAFGALALGAWLADAVPDVAAELPGDARRTLSVLRYPAAFVALLLALSALAPFIDTAMRRLTGRR
ncbi:MAG: hypothetical protein AAF968_07065 [Pseudomonadota bacterium]